MSGLNVDSAIRQATQVKESLDAVMLKWLARVVANTENDLVIPHELALDVCEALGEACGFMAGLIAAAVDNGHVTKPPT